MSDPYESMLGERTEEFRLALQDVVARRGGVMDPNGRMAAMPSGAGLAFDNLARAVAAEGGDTPMVELIEKFVDGLADSPELPALAWADLLPRLRLRMMPRVEGLGESPFIRPLADDLAVALAIEFDETVLTVTNPARLPAHDESPDDILQRAADNTWQVLVTGDFDMQHARPGLWRMAGASFFTASAMLFPERVLLAFTDDTYDDERGLLMAAPSRHVAYIGTLGGAGSLQACLEVLLPAMAKDMEGMTGLVSRSVYYLDKHGLQHLVRPASEGRILVVADERLRQRLDDGEL